MIEEERLAREILGIYTEYYPFLKDRTIVRPRIVTDKMHFEHGRAIKTERLVIEILVYMTSKIYKCRIDISCCPSRDIMHWKTKRAFQTLINAISNDKNVVDLGDAK